MNTTIYTPHLNVAVAIVTFCGQHRVPMTLDYDHQIGGLFENPNKYRCELTIQNPFLFTKLQDQLLGAFPHTAFDIDHAAA